LIERAEPASGVIARVHQPILRLLGGIDQPLDGHLCLCSVNENRENAWQGDQQQTEHLS
jgi:hypothetical protein